MRRMAIIVAFLLLCTVDAFAHKPSEIDVVIEGSRVEIEVRHRVRNPQKHYVDRIIITLNDRKIIEQGLSLQTKDIQTAIYNVPSLKAGDVLDVEATCNVFGKLKKQIIIEKQTPHLEEDTENILLEKQEQGK